MLSCLEFYTGRGLNVPSYEGAGILKSSALCRVLPDKDFFKTGGHSGPNFVFVWPKHAKLKQHLRNVFLFCVYLGFESFTVQSGAFFMVFSQFF